MNAEITRGGKRVRPSFNHFDCAPAPVPVDAITSQLTESLRNLSEAHFESLIVVQRQQLEVLKRIDRRLATKIKIRGHK